MAKAMRVGNGPAKPETAVREKREKGEKLITSSLLLLPESIRHSD